MTEPLVIVGGGHAGLRAAMAARQSGYDRPLVMVDKDSAPLPYERPPLSKAGMAGEPLVPILSQHALDALSITWRRTVARQIDRVARSVHLADGMVQPYGRLLLATGARAKKLAMVDRAGGLVLRSAADAEILRQQTFRADRIAILDGGFIGLELAASLREQGKAVTVLEAAPRLASRALSADAGQALRSLHEAAGTEIRCGTTVKDIQQDRDAMLLTCSERPGLMADLVIAGVGAEPRMELARACGLDLEDGIIVNERMQTSDPHIFAAGDACSVPVRGKGRRQRYESWQMAGEQGALAGRMMVAPDGQIPPAFLPYFWSEQYDHRLQVAGDRTGSVQAVERHVPAGGHLRFFLNPESHVGAIEALGKGTELGKEVRLAMRLIQTCAAVDTGDLATATVRLKSLLPRSDTAALPLASN